MKQKGIIADWNLETYTPESIDAATEALITEAKKFYDAVGEVKSADVSYQTVIKVVLCHDYFYPSPFLKTLFCIWLQPLLEVECKLANEESPLTGIQNVSINKKLRDASVASSKTFNSFYVEMSMRKDVFDNVVAFKESEEFGTLSDEKQRYVEKCVTIGKRNGLNLDEATREKVKEIKKKIDNLATEFSSNLNEENTILLFTVEELAGVPQYLIDSFEKDADGKCKVTLKYPHFFPVTRKCRVPETRRRIETAFNCRCMEENTKILEELVTLRQKQADLLGYKDHASYVLEVKFM